MGLQATNPIAVIPKSVSFVNFTQLLHVKFVWCNSYSRLEGNLAIVRFRRSNAALDPMGSIKASPLIHSICGYSCVSLFLASCVVKCQLVFERAVLRGFVQATTSASKVA